MSVDLQAPAALPTVSTDSSLGGPQSLSGYFGEEKIALRFETIGDVTLCRLVNITVFFVGE